MNSLLIRHPNFESAIAQLARAQDVKAWMKDNLKVNELRGDEKYGIVSHSVLIASLTAKGIDSKDHRGLKGYAWLKNC